MAYTTNNDKMLEAVLTDPDLMKFGKYSPVEIQSIYQAVSGHQHNSVDKNVK